MKNKNLLKFFLHRHFPKKTRGSCLLFQIPHSTPSKAMCLPIFPLLEMRTTLLSKALEYIDNKSGYSHVHLGFSESDTRSSLCPGCELVPQGEPVNQW